MTDYEYTDSPYRTIPDEFIERYTMNYQITIINSFVNDKMTLDQTIWTDEYIQKCTEIFTPDNIMNGNITEPYPGVSKDILYAINKYEIRNKKVAVVGSLMPWIEAMLLNNNNIVTTVEYNVPIVNFTNLNATSYWDFQKTDEMYDCIITFSSVEHSGLGRYGDPLDPDGDIKTMYDIHKNLKENGLLLWGAPVGHDALVWNEHRVYGKLRLPLLFQNFDEVEWVAVDKTDTLNRPLAQHSIQPVIVLRKK